MKVLVAGSAGHLGETLVRSSFCCVSLGVRQASLHEAGFCLPCSAGARCRYRVGTESIYHLSDRRVHISLARLAQGRLLQVM